MKTYELRNELSKLDQHKHIYIKDDKGRLVPIALCKIEEYNGVIVIVPAKG